MWDVTMHTWETQLLHVSKGCFDIDIILSSAQYTGTRNNFRKAAVHNGLTSQRQELSEFCRLAKTLLRLTASYQTKQERAIHVGKDGVLSMQSVNERQAYLPATAGSTANPKRFTAEAALRCSAAKDDRGRMFGAWSTADPLLVSQQQMANATMNTCSAADIEMLILRASVCMDHVPFPRLLPTTHTSPGCWEARQHLRRLEELREVLPLADECNQGSSFEADVQSHCTLRL